MASHNLRNTICGVYYLQPVSLGYGHTNAARQYLPQISLSAHASILSNACRTTLTQTFLNTAPENIAELRYTFPIYDGVSVVGFTCTINDERVIHGVVKEKQQARETFDKAVSRGETAGLLEQRPDASDVFTTSIGNVPARGTIKVDIAYLGELKYDAGLDGIVYTIPTHIAPRYQPASRFAQSVLADGLPPIENRGISITVDIEMQATSVISSVQSPSHPIAVTIGSTSRSVALVDHSGGGSPQLASASLSLGTASLDKDFVLQIVSTNTANPVAILEAHPTIPNQRALMMTLVPKFHLPAERPEIVFVCDRSGSMRGQKIENLKSALRLFLKSLPVGVKFNICSFGSHHSFLFPKGSMTYDGDSLKTAMQAVDTFQADYGGTELRGPIEKAFERRYKDMDLEVFVLTDGQVWQQNELFDMVNIHAKDGGVRVFTLGIGDGASHALIEGMARAGNGFAQSVREDEKMDKKIVRMLKAALTPHVHDYTMEIKYRKTAGTTTDEDFELIDRLDDLAVEETQTPGAMDVDERDRQRSTSNPKGPISLLDPSYNPSTNDQGPGSSTTDKFSHVPVVTTPRVIQTPCKIPPLYSFSRTNVYVLLSPETVDNIPETVVLRATSKHGPLELTIPVQIPSNPAGETIHQLAARHTVRELEEGRGWIFHAKSKDCPDGTLLKDKYQGRFADMVEREAVRLGVQFQVGEKWCSFVAVDTNGDESVDESAVAMPELHGNLVSNMQGGAMKRYSQRTSMSRAGGGLHSRPADALYSTPQEAVRMSLQTGLSGNPSQSRPSPHPLFEAGGSLLPRCRKRRGRKNCPNHQANGDLWARSVHGKLTHGLVSPSLDRSRGAFKAGGSLGGAWAPPHMLMQQPTPKPFDSTMRSPSFERLYDQKRIFSTHGPSSGFSAGGNSPVAHAPVPRGVSGTQNPATHANETVLEKLVRLQNFAGFWSWDSELLVTVGVEDKHVSALLTKIGRSAHNGTDAMATLVVVSFLRTLLGAEKDSWELLVAKAVSWLETQPNFKNIGEIEEVISEVKYLWDEVSGPS